jgi:hypothetical protein
LKQIPDEKTMTVLWRRYPPAGMALVCGNALRR